MDAERTKGEGSQQQRPCGRWMAAAEPSPGEHDRRCSGPGAARGKEGVRAAVRQSAAKSSPVSYRSYLAWIVFLQFQEALAKSRPGTQSSRPTLLVLFLSFAKMSSQSIHGTGDDVRCLSRVTQLGSPMANILQQPCMHIPDGPNRNASSYLLISLYPPSY
ncbi:predicted protein [Histoplasma capsulatum var. duboisii H88]|uniref:Predicted protein n=1 Tax=Ajellomyces capsulatus (strain H88) TaxID=544711 RepID=F0UGA1_AJEC8|nr:predicted protein [Histoplasma capsulatum var. duboisii H88]